MKMRKYCHEIASTSLLILLSNILRVSDQSLKVNNHELSKVHISWLVHIPNDQEGWQK